MPHETFEQFMQRCLHDPRRGYYSKNIRAIGSRGDFTTAPQLAEAPAIAIAAWATQAMRFHQTRHLIEVGPGMGTLSKQVIRNLPISLRYTTKLHLVDSSPALLAHQKNTLGKRASFHSSIHEALESCNGNAVIFSNELVDAFPVRLFQKNQDHWQEIALIHKKNQTREIFINPSSLPESSIFELDFPPGQRVEVHESYQKWLQSWLPLWQRGEMLTIDYGTLAKDLYHRRPHGSIRGYLLQQKIEGAEIYQNPGLQDLTADVNFTDLIEWGNPWLKHEKSENFADFISPYAKSHDSQFHRACEYFMSLRQSPISRTKLNEH
jgi:SAM-dependent MidA family methyltransferase